MLMHEQIRDKDAKKLDASPSIPNPRPQISTFTDLINQTLLPFLFD